VNRIEQIKILPSDVSFEKYRPVGDPGCLCSRCLRPISVGTLPILAFPRDVDLAFRYHPSCVGMEDEN
jgi:hypothetical protein